MPQDMNQTFDIPLHDIKTIVEIDEFSLYYFLGFSLIVTIIIVTIIYYIYKWIKNKNSYNKRKEYLKLLKQLKLNDAKYSAYSFTTLGAIFKDDTPKHSKIYTELLQKLEEHKYKKEVDSFDKQTLKLIKQYVDMIDV